MAGFNRNNRGAKRQYSSSPPSSSSATCSYYVTTAVFLVLCIAGAWMLASTSVAGTTSSQAGRGQIARALSLSSFMQGDVEGVKESDGGEGNGEDERKEEEGGELQQSDTQQNEEKKEEGENQISEDGRADRSENSETEGTENQNSSETNHEEIEQEPKTEENHEETEQGTKNEENHEETEQGTKNEENHEDSEQEIKKEKQKLKEESSLDGGMEEEQKRHETESNDSNENNEDNDSKEEPKPSENTENIEQVTEENHQENQENQENLSNSSSERTEAETDKWATQAGQSEKEKERRGDNDGNPDSYGWRICNETARADYIPCLDNIKEIKKLRPENYRHYEHRERHCPEEPPTCLVPVPEGYRRPVEWPKSRDKIWYNNVPHTKLAEVKGHQNWVKVTGQYLSFPGGGTQFIHGALHYIDFLQQSVKGIGWGKHTRVVLDVGCGVASFGGYLFERDVLTMSFAPKDEHEAQVQLALERGIPAISAVMGAHRLPFPGGVFDLVHCARCRVPWHADGGQLLLELNRVLRPGGFFVWSATPVYQKLEEDVEIWKAMKSLTRSMCWDLVTIKKDRLNGVGAAFFRKPTNNECYTERRRQNPPMCEQNDDPNAAWYIPMKTCMHTVPTSESVRGASWPSEWPKRLHTAPYWLNASEQGIDGKPAQDDFNSDTRRWKDVVKNSYLSEIDWSRVRNVMDMRAVYGGFAAALREEKVWVMNVVSTDAATTLPIIYERGLFGIYHDWCESFSTYPRSYDLLHADHLFSSIKDRCPILPIIVEVDRIVRPGGKLIIRDDSSTIGEIETLLKSLHWNVVQSKDQEGVIFAEKSDWRPESSVESA
ncbi:hypothetical protein LUZ60_007156 [Juncus effusus]|nr:hypothetical protein LUZ60_007156 [Juncus effusus]